MGAFIGTMAYDFNNDSFSQNALLIFNACKTYNVIDIINKTKKTLDKKYELYKQEYGEDATKTYEQFLDQDKYSHWIGNQLGKMAQAVTFFVDYE